MAIAETGPSAEILHSLLTQAARAGIDAGEAGTAVESTPVGIAADIMGTSMLGDRTIVYPHSISRMQAEGATETVKAQHAETTLIRQILKLNQGHCGYIASTISLGEETWIVELGNGPFNERAPYIVIHDQKDTHTFHTTLDEALLYAIELRAGGDPHRGGYRFAARALGVKTTD